MAESVRNLFSIFPLIGSVVGVGALLFYSIDEAKIEENAKILCCFLGSKGRDSGIKKEEKVEENAKILAAMKAGQEKTAEKKDEDVIY